MQRTTSNLAQSILTFQTYSQDQYNDFRLRSPSLKKRSCTGETMQKTLGPSNMSEKNVQDASKEHQWAFQTKIQINQFVSSVGCKVFFSLITISLNIRTISDQDQKVKNWTNPDRNQIFSRMRGLDQQNFEKLGPVGLRSVGPWSQTWTPSNEIWILPET